MDWNEYNRELQKRVSDPGVRYCLGIAYERLLDCAKQIDQNNQMLLMFAETMKDMISVTESQEQRIKSLRKTIRGETEGVSLSSVPITNED